MNVTTAQLAPQSMHTRVVIALLAVVVVFALSLAVGIRAISGTSSHAPSSPITQLLDCHAGRPC